MRSNRSEINNTNWTSIEMSSSKWPHPCVSFFSSSSLTHYSAYAMNWVESPATQLPSDKKRYFCAFISLKEINLCGWFMYSSRKQQTISVVSAQRAKTKISRETRKMWEKVLLSFAHSILNSFHTEKWMKRFFFLLQRLFYRLIVNPCSRKSEREHHSVLIRTHAALLRNRLGARPDVLDIL